MLISRVNKVGLDVLIDRLQKKLYNKLSVLWAYDLLAFPRCYINYEEGKRNIEYHDAENDYKTVLYAEDSKFFFTQEDDMQTADDNGFTANIELYFIIDFRNINLETDQDQQVLSDVVGFIQNNTNFDVISVQTDFNSIFRNTVFIEEIDNLRPYYCFKLNLRTERFTINLKPCTNE